MLLITHLKNEETLAQMKRTHYERGDIKTPGKSKDRLSMYEYIALCIDNSRTGLDTSNNQCSAPAVMALKKLLTVSYLQFISTRELVKCIHLYNYHWLSYWKHRTILE